MNRSLATALILALVSTSCGRRGEGQRCDMNNFNEDCAAGLQCVPLEGSTIRNAAVCCPPDDPTKEACFGSDLGLRDDAGATLPDTDAGED